MLKNKLNRKHKDTFNFNMKDVVNLFSKIFLCSHKGFGSTNPLSSFLFAVFLYPIPAILPGSWSMSVTPRARIFFGNAALSRVRVPINIPDPYILIVAHNYSISCLLTLFIPLFAYTKILNWLFF